MNNNPKQSRLLWFGLLLLPLVLFGLGASGWSWWTWAVSPIQPPSETAAPGSSKIKLQIPSGTSVEEIGRKLQAARLVRSLLAWKLWSRWLALQDPQGGFQAGTYELSPGMSLQAIAEQIWTGDVVETQFTIPEGWSMGEMAAYFAAEGFFSAEEFLQAAKQIPRDRYPWLPADLPFLEGFLYPDTYQLPADQFTPTAAIQAMLDRFEQIALPLYQNQPAPNRLNLREWVTLASIVEREAVVARERPLIAGVFFNRLNQAIPLGADPTVEYGLGIRQTPDQTLTLAQVNTPSAYNTYRNLGLPPTPIASPGKASLQAVLQPAKTDYLYFVARYDGTHIFSRTLAEHETAQTQIHDQRAVKAQPSRSPAP